MQVNEVANEISLPKRLLTFEGFIHQIAALLEIYGEYVFMRRALKNKANLQLLD